MLRRPADTWHRAGLCVLTLALASGSAAHAQTVAPGLSAVANDVVRLAPGALSDESTFQISDAVVVVFDLVTTTPGLTVVLVTPDGFTVAEATIAAINGTIERRSVAPNTGSVLVDPLTTPGEHIVISVPTPLAGLWTLRVSAPAGTTQEIAVAITAIMDSTTGAALIPLPKEVVLGQAVTITAAAFAGPQPVTGATVNLQVLAPNGAVTILSLRDDGVAPDTSVGDGLYSGAYVPAELGLHDALAIVTGVTPTGTAVVREAAAIFGVVPRTLALLGAVNSSTVDANFNGFIDALLLNIDVNVVEAGEFLARAVLRSSTGATVERTTRVTLGTGPITIAVSFFADDLRSLGADGPYQIGPVEILFVAPTGAQPADLLNDAGLTPPIRLNDLEQASIRFAGTATDTGIDLNGNGLFDQLRVVLDIVFLVSGTYSWSASLFDGNGTEIGFSSGTVFTAGGAVPIPLLFDGKAIGANGVNGPYTIGNLLVNGSGGSLVLLSVTQTSAFLARQFEGFTANQPPVANAGADRIVRVGSLVVLNGAGSTDPDNAPQSLQFSWLQNAGPAVVLDAPTTTTPSFTPTLPATYTMRLSVTDGAATDDDDVVITVPMLGDMDLDNDVDTLDLNEVLARRNTAADGPNDIRDINGDRRIDVLDARVLTTLCSRVRCAVQ